VRGAQQWLAADRRDRSLEGARLGIKRHSYRSRIADHQRDGKRPVGQLGVVVEQRLRAIPPGAGDGARAEREVQQPRPP
jgi:hypothetical protein